MKLYTSTQRAFAPRGRSVPFRGVCIAAVSVLSLALAACGGSPAKAGASNAPIKVMTWAPINSTLTNYPAIKGAAQTYEKYINAKGGIAGHQVQVLFCDEKGDPTAASNCARQAIQEKVVAVVGSFGYTGDATIPLLKGANIAMFGGCCSNSVADLTSSNAFIMGDGPTYGAALAQKAVDDGKKKISLVVVDGAQSYQVPVENALKANGLKLNKSVVLPATAQDLSPQAAQTLNDGTDAVIMIAGADSIKAFMTAYVQTGSTARIYGPQGNLTEDVAKAFKTQLEGAVTGNTYPDISSPVWADFRAALKQYNAPDISYNGLDGLGTWAAYTAFTNVAESIKGAIDSKSFLDAASTATNVDTKGMTAKIDFSKEWTNGPKGYARLFNRTAVFATFKDGKLVPIESDFKDYSALMLGQK